MKKEIKWELEKKSGGKYLLSSLVSTNFGGIAKNYICSGSKEYCEEIKSRLEKGQLEDGNS